MVFVARFRKLPDIHPRVEIFRSYEEAEAWINAFDQDWRDERGIAEFPSEKEAQAEVNYLVGPAWGSR